MQVSVIIPVFNARRYLRQAVESALAQQQTAEVLLIDDGSTDGSLDECRALAAQYPLVKVHTQPKGNRGSAAARNIGLGAARFPFIAFLDADDYYLPDRFALTARIFADGPDIDGVYEAVENFFEDDQARDKGQALANKTLIMTSETIHPDRLFEALVVGDKGGFQTNGLTIRADLLQRTGGFDENLRIGQDKALWFKMAALGRLVPGDLHKPVCRRRIHHTNVSNVDDLARARLKREQVLTVLRWALRHRLTPARINLLWDQYVHWSVRTLGPYPGLWARRRVLIALTCACWWRCPRMVFSTPYWRFVGSLLRLTAKP